MKEVNVRVRTQLTNRLPKFSVRTKLIMMLVIVSFCSILASSYICSRVGQDILSEKVFKELTNVRETNIEQVNRYFNFIIDHTETLSDDEMFVSAMKEFKQAFDKLAKVNVPKEYDRKLEEFYSKEFVPRLKKSTNVEPVTETFLPKTNIARYIQYHYIANNPYPLGEKYKLDDPKDGSEYSKINLKYTHNFTNIAERFGYRDIFLIDTQGNIVYSLANNTDLAINLFSGPVVDSNVIEMFRDCRRSTSIEYVKVVDFQPYIMSYNKPAAFVGSPIYDGTKMVGVLAFQLPSTGLNQIINHNNKWKENGLGETGEVHLVGSDSLFRSDSRFLIEDSKTFAQTVRNNGLPESTIQKILTYNTTILLQPTRSKGVEQALLGKKLELKQKDFRGVEVLGAYAPIDFAGLRWAIAAQIDADEAFASLKFFEKNVLIAGSLIMVLTTVAAIWIAGIFIKPIERLTATTQQVEAGDEGAMVSSGTRDEYQDLARAFNQTVYSFRSQIQERDRSIAENETLIQKLFPLHIAKRIKAGEGVIADFMPNVTVMFVDLHRFTRLSGIISADKVVFFLDELVDGFDDLMDKYGLEKIKTIGDGYMAVCGLSVPHLDSDKRTIDCALEMIAQVRRFSDEQGFNIELRVGINTGEVVAGTVGKSRFTYDVWGNTVNNAHRLKDAAPPGGILVSADIHERLIDVYDFEPFRPIAEPDKEALEAWLLKVERQIVDSETANQANQRKNK